MKIKIDVSNHTIIRIFSLALAFYLGLEFVLATRAALVLIFVAFFLAVALSPPVNYLARRLPGGNRTLATAIAYIVTLSLLGLLLSTIVPPLIQQTQSLINNFPEYVENLTRDNGFISDFVQNNDLVQKIRESRDAIVASISGAGGPIVDLFQRIAGSVVAVLTVLVLTFFMLVEAPGWLKRFWELQPKEKRQHRQELAERMYHTVTGFVNGQLLIAFIAAVSTMIMLIILNIPFAVPLAVIVGLFGLIPLIGATLGAIVVILVALFQSVTDAIILLIFFVIYQQIENNVIQPLIQSRTVEMTPLLIFISAIIGVALAGLLGALVAIPIAASLRILINDYIDRHHLAHE